MTENNEPIRLMRIKPKGILGGVCAGLGYYLGWATWLIRSLAVGLVVIGGTGFMGYIILWIFMPSTDEVPPDYDERTY